MAPTTVDSAGLAYAGISVERSFAVKWCEPDGQSYVGRLELGPNALQLVGDSDAAVAVDRRFGYEELKGVRIGRLAGDRVDGRRALVLERSDGSYRLTSTAMEAGVLQELAERLAELRLSAPRRAAVVLPLAEGALERVRELAAAGPPFDPTETSLTSHRSPTHGSAPRRLPFPRSASGSRASTALSETDHKGGTMTEPTTRDPLSEVKNLAGARAIFSRVLVGIDRSPESREAARQAATLMDGEGSLELLAAYQVVYPVAIGPTMATTPPDRELLREAAADALRRATADLTAMRDLTAKVVEERPAQALLHDAERAHATLIALGSHGQGRLPGILIGSTATEIVHKAPCSVLVSRKGAHPTPRTIVVGVDGSSESAAAYAVAADLAERFAADLWPVVAWGGKGVDRQLVDAITAKREDSPDEPVDALVASAADADLVVVGSRGLHGLRALGSVSERVAHESRTTTLIVRQPAWQAVIDALTQGTERQT